MAIRFMHPVRTYQAALRNRQLICDPRGYCGPFINQRFYDAFPDPEWHGMGECIHCRNVLMTVPELLKRMRAIEAEEREADVAAGVCWAARGAGVWTEMGRPRRQELPVFELP